MEHERLITSLQQAHAQWQLPAARALERLPESGACLSPLGAAEIVAEAERCIQRKRLTERSRDAALIATKAPHAGSAETVLEIVARCLAFGVSVEQVIQTDPANAERLAHALYPDVWLNFDRAPSGPEAWRRLSELFDRAEFATIFGERYSRDLVVPAHRACSDNDLSLEELMAIWQQGREALRRDGAEATYGARTAELLFKQDDTYQWYRGPFPIGIHKVESGTMAFALRDARLYDGRPTILLNGHFAMLSRLFRCANGSGATVIELGLDARRSVHEVRLRLTGAADIPEQCLPGTIRRDAHDRIFKVECPETPVTAWANVVHSSDGYLAGAIETAAVLGSSPAPRLWQRLRDNGYRDEEIDRLIASDPVVADHQDEQRLTERTADTSLDECLATIARLFPPLRSVAVSSPSSFPLTRLLTTLRTDDESLSQLINRPTSEGSARRLRARPVSAVSLPADLSELGVALLHRSAVGLLVPLAGSGGRFGGYDMQEGSRARLKALRPLFSVLEGREASALDVRAGHAREIELTCHAEVPMLLSCSHHTESHARRWLATWPQLDATIARVPELYRICRDTWREVSDTARANIVDHIVRDTSGQPLLKPSGTLGLLIAGAASGTLERWDRSGIEVAVAANSDDVGFRLDRRVLGMFVAQPDIDAVVMVIADDQTLGTGANPSLRRGGLLREHLVQQSWSAYVEEHADRASSAPGGVLQHQSDLLPADGAAACHRATGRYER